MTHDARWRICIDFGTAASKVSICAPVTPDVHLSEAIHPLQLSPEDARDAFTAPSALLFREDSILFGARALDAADEAETMPLQSFKLFLAAGDLNASLEQRLSRNIDPSGAFTQRDCLTLYAAHLLRLTERAIAAHASLPPQARLAPYRYTHPNWRMDMEAQTVMADIFASAAALAGRIGDAFDDTRGLNRLEAWSLLDEARKAAAPFRFDCAIFEARAAAESYFLGGREALDYLLVCDIGAGTADFAAFGNQAGGGREILAARKTLALGGDVVDENLVALFLDRAKSERKPGARQRLWKRLKGRARPLKEALFHKGACETVYEGRRIVLRKQDLLRDKGFQRYQRALADALRESLSRIGPPNQRIGILFAGGGSKLPILQDIVKSLRRRNVHLMPATPDWIKSHYLAQKLDANFPQLAISIGGALSKGHAA